MYINSASCLIVLFKILMNRNSSTQENAFQRWDLRMRRLRLMTDIMEDYQENVRRMIRLMGCEMGISNHIYPNSNMRVNSDEWMNRVSNITTDMYSPDTPSDERRDRAPYSFNEMPPPPTPIQRNGVIYTQLSGISINSGITSDQIANSTEVVQYDASMNESRCPITLDNFELGQNILRINGCQHIFGESALRQWFTNHNVCPVCRTVISGTRQNNTTTTSDTSSSQQTSVINQIMTSIVNSLNSAPNNNAYYESELEFNVGDLMDAYNRLNNSSTNQNDLS